MDDRQTTKRLSGPLLQIMSGESYHPVKKHPRVSKELRKQRKKNNKRFIVVSLFVFSRLFVCLVALELLDSMGKDTAYSLTFFYGLMYDKKQVE